MTSADYPTQSAAEQTDTLTRAAHRRTEGLVLCGGQGSRVAGADKGLIPVDGAPAAARVARLLEPLCARLYISANRNLEHYRELALGTVVPDRRPGFPGPLAALEAVAGQLQQTYLLVLPCDMPDLLPAVPARLLAGLAQRPDLGMLYARTPGREHYLCAALRSDRLEQAALLLDAGEHAVRALVRRLGGEGLLFDNQLADSFRNRNARSDWPDGV